MYIKALFRKEIEELATASRRLGENGYVSSHGGNLSYRVDENIVLITPTKVEKRQMRPEDIVAVDFSGQMIWSDTDRQPTGETPMHLLILKSRPDLNAIVHAHPPVLTGFSMVEDDILARPLLPEPVLEVGPILKVPYAEPVSEELANNFKEYIPLTNAWLMESHGVTLASSEGITRAMGLLEMVEAMARSTSIAAQLGKVATIPIHEVRNMERTISKRNMPRPGDPRFITNLTDLYFAECGIQ